MNFLIPAFAVLSLFSILIQGVPANDKCVNAILLKNGDAPLTGETTGATFDFSGSSIDSCVAPNAGGLVWYKVVGNGRTLRVHTNFPETDIDTVLNVYESDLCSNLPISKNEGGNHYCVDGNDDISSDNFASSVEFCTEKNKVYLISVGGYAGEQGTFNIEVRNAGICRGVSSNSKCGNAQYIELNETVLSLIENGKVQIRGGECLTLDDDSLRAGRGLFYEITGTGNIFQLLIGGEIGMVQPTFRIWAVDSNLEGCMYFDDWNLSLLPKPYFPICIGGSTGHDGYTWTAIKDQKYMIFAEGHHGSNGVVGWAVIELPGTGILPATIINANFGGLIPDNYGSTH